MEAEGTPKTVEKPEVFRFRDLQAHKDFSDSERITVTSFFSSLKTNLDSEITSSQVRPENPQHPKE